MIRTFRYPLHPTVDQEQLMLSWLRACCDLFNGALQERRDAWSRQRRGVSYQDQTKSLTEIRATGPTWKAMPVEVQRSALARVDRAFKAFFRRCKAGEKPGHPRFRSWRRYDSFSYPVMGRLVTGDGRSARIPIPKLGDVRLSLYRPLCGTPVSVSVRRGSTGRWWACVSCDLGEAPMAAEVRTAVGADVGLRMLAALSTGELIENPRHGQAAAKVLAERQRRLARKRKGSNSRRRAVVLVAKAHRRIQDQRLDHSRKLAADLYSRFDAVVVEDISISRMVHGNLARSIHDASWGVLLHALACKAESAGKLLVKVDPRGTSQRCSACGAVVTKDLSVRIHDCPHCGLKLDRDVNAARNIEALGRSALRPSATQQITDEGQHDPSQLAGGW